MLEGYQWDQCEEGNQGGNGRVSTLLSKYNSQALGQAGSEGTRMWGTCWQKFEARLTTGPNQSASCHGERGCRCQNEGVQGNARTYCWVSVVDFRVASSGLANKYMLERSKRVKIENIELKSVTKTTIEKYATIVKT